MRMLLKYDVKQQHGNKSHVILPIANHNYMVQHSLVLYSYYQCR